MGVLSMRRGGEGGGGGLKQQWMRAVCILFSLVLGMYIRNSSR